MASLKQLAIRGTIWTFIAFGLRNGLRFANNVILARLLDPELFGLMALITVFIVGLELFSDVGIQPSVIQNKRGDTPEFYNTAWTIQVVRGFILWIGTIIIAWPVSYFYEDQRLIWMIPVVGFGTVLNGFQATAQPLLTREVNQRRLTLYHIVNQLVALIALVTWALISPTVWALVGGGLIGAAFKTLYSHRLLPSKPNQFHWDPEAAKEIFSFGKWIFVSTAMTFLSLQSDRLILGKLFTLTMLGVYNIAFTLVDMPRQIILSFSNSIIFPIVAKQVDLPRHELRQKILSKRKLLLGGIILMLVPIAGFGDILISFLYDDRYSDATWMMTFLAFGIWPYLLFAIMNPVLLALGKSIYSAQANFVKFLFFWVGVPVGFNLGGPVLAVIILALADLFPYFIISYGTWREKLSCLRQDIIATTAFVGAIALIFTVRTAIGFPPALFDIINNYPI